jgi:hypothetical protein
MLYLPQVPTHPMPTFIFAMLASMWSILGWTKEPTVSPPPPAIITGVRIPADGTPAYLLSLTTISTTSTIRATDDFLFHIPDLRQYWTPEHAWRRRDIHRLDLHQEHSPQQENYLQQQIRLWKRHDLQRQAWFLDCEQNLRLRQQLHLPQEHRALQEPHLSCTGTYYVFYSFEVDELPQNLFVPAWLSGDHGHGYYGDVFVVKVGLHELGQDDWATYEDIVPDFLNLLSKTAL